MKSWPLFKATLSGLVEHRRALVRLFAVPFGISLVVMVYGSVRLHNLIAQGEMNLVDLQSYETFDWVRMSVCWVFYLLGSIAVVAWWRDVLGLEPDASLFRSDFGRIGRALWAYIKYNLFALWPLAASIAGLVVVNSLNGPEAVSMGVGGVLIATAIGTLIFAVGASARLMVAPLLAVVDEPVHVRSLFRQRKGFGGSAFGALLIGNLIIMPFTLVASLVIKTMFLASASLMTVLAFDTLYHLWSVACFLLSTSLILETYKVWRAGPIEE
jgi:hypothetical protein